MSASQPEPPADAASVDADADTVFVQTDAQLHAVGNLMRQRIIRVLREGPASVTQVAKYLSITKGNAGYHMKVLAEAGLVRVVDTRRVRGVTEILYGPVGRLLVLPEPAPGEPDHLMRSALAEVEAMPVGMPADMRLKFLRLSPADFDAAVALLQTAFDQVCAMHDPAQPAAAVFTVAFRPRDLGAGPLANSNAANSNAKVAAAAMNAVDTTATAAATAAAAAAAADVTAAAVAAAERGALNDDAAYH